MAHDSGNEKQHAHELIDQLDPAQVSAVVPLLQFMLLDPLSRSLAAAPVEQHSISPEEALPSTAAKASRTKTFFASSVLLPGRPTHIEKNRHLVAGSSRRPPRHRPRDRTILRSIAIVISPPARAM